MKRFAMVAVLLITSFFSYSFELSTGIQNEFMVVDGKEVGTFASPSRNLELPAGLHQIVIRFNSSLKDGSKETFFVSRPIVFEINLQADTTVSLPRMKRYSQVVAHFNRGAKWMLKYSNGTTELIKYEELVGDGFSPYSDVEGLVAAYNKEKGISFSESGAEKLSEQIVTVSDDGEVTISGDPTTQLKLWYIKASKEERKTFKKWMIDQD